MAISLVVAVRPPNRLKHRHDYLGELQGYNVAFGQYHTAGKRCTRECTPVMKIFKKKLKAIIASNPTVDRELILTLLTICRSLNAGKTAVRYPWYCICIYSFITCVRQMINTTLFLKDLTP